MAGPQTAAPGLDIIIILSGVRPRELRTSKRGLRPPVGYCGIRAKKIATENVPREVEQEGVKVSADRN